MAGIADLSDAELEAIAGQGGAAPAAGGDFSSFVQSEAQRLGVRPDLALKLMHQESRGRADAVSPKGARGPFQLMPATAAELGVDIDDPHQNITGGLTYLKKQIDDFGGDERLGLAAYNAGPGAVRKHGGVPPFRETQDYVASILGDEPLAGGAGQDDISSLSDDELERLAAGGGADTSTANPDPVGEAVFIAAPKTAMQAGKGFVDAKTGEYLDEGQSATYADLTKRGKLDRNATPGSEAFPLAQRDAADLPKPGDWYVPVGGGQPKQVPQSAGAGTLASAVIDLGLPSLKLLTRDAPLNDRYEAIKRAIQSGVALGGRNEAVAGIDALGSKLAAGVPLKDRFTKTLAAEDQKSAQARRDFPLAYDAAAAGGALASGAVSPAGLIPRLATSGAGGFLSTDGSIARRAVGAGLGMAGGEALNFAIPRVAGAVIDMAGVPRRVGAPQTDAAATALQALGTRMEDLTPQARARLTAELRRGADPADAAAIALNEGLPVPIPMKRGDVTGLPSDQIQFNMSLRGARGARPAAEAQELVARQQDAIRSNVDQIGAGMAGRPDGRIPMRGEGGRAASDGLVAQREAHQGVVREAYDAAREAGDGAILPREQVPVLAARLHDSVRDFDLERVPAVGRALTRLDDIGGATQVRDVFAVRSQLSGLRASTDGVERAAAGAATRELDRFLNDAVEQSLFSGDQEAIGAWREAISRRREMAEAFDQGDLADKLTRQEGSGNQRRLTVDPEEAANYIFGRSALGMVGRKNLYRDMEKVRDLLGPESEGWNGLRAEAFVRMAGAGDGPMEAGAQQFSGAKFAKAWAKANTEDARLVGLLFTPAERARIDGFAGIAARVTSPVKGGDNPSNTAAALKALGRMSSSTFAMGKAVPLLREALLGIEEIADRATARAALRPTARRTVRPLRSGQIPARGGGYLGAAVSEPQPN